MEKSSCDWGGKNDHNGSELQAKKDFKYKIEIGFAAVIDKSITESLNVIINGLSVNYEILFAKYFG